MKTTLRYLLTATAASLLMTVSAHAAGPEIVKGPSDAQPFTLKITHTFPPEQMFPPCS